MERQNQRSRRNTISLLVNSVEDELHPRRTNNGERRDSAPLASSRANESREGNGMHDSGCGHDVVNGTMSVLKQRQNVVALKHNGRVAQTVSTNLRSIASRNDQVATRMYSSPNHPPELISEDAYTRDSNIHAIRGYGFNNRSGQTYPEIPSFCQEAQPPLTDSSRFLPPPNNQRLPESPLPLEKCNVAPLLRPLHPENVTQVRNVGSIGLPSAHNLLKLPEHGSHVQTGPSEAEQTFDSLIRIVLNHPVFPLIFKGVCETTTGKTPIIHNKTSQVLMERTVEKVEEHETLCRKIGLPNAQKFMNGVDLFFTVFNAAFKSLQSDERPPIPGPLHATICACGQRERAKDADLTSEFALQFNRESTHMPAKRTRPSDAARRRLENWFNENYKNPYPTPEQKQQLADECGIAMEQINNYFGNRRMREKRRALGTRKQLGKVSKTAKRAGGCENSVLAPITKWRNIVLAKEKNIVQAECGAERGKRMRDKGV